MKRYKKDPFIGTSKIAEFTATRAQVIAALGEPTKCWKDDPTDFLRKTVYEWLLRTEIGPVSVYDWKVENPDFGDDELIVWSVGGRANTYKNRQIHPVTTWAKSQTGFDVRQTLWENSRF